MISRLPFVIKKNQCELGGLHTYIYTHTYLITYIHTYIHKYIHIYIITYIHNYIINYIHRYIITYIHTMLGWQIEPGKGSNQKEVNLIR